jgi:hypothetical protein
MKTSSLKRVHTHTYKQTNTHSLRRDIESRIKEEINLTTIGWVNLDKVLIKDMFKKENKSLSLKTST